MIFQIHKQEYIQGFLLGTEVNVIALSRNIDGYFRSNGRYFWTNGG